MKPNSPKTKNDNDRDGDLDQELAALGQQLRTQADQLATSYPATDPRLHRPTPPRRAAPRKSWIGVSVTALASLLLGVVGTTLWQATFSESRANSPAAAESIAPATGQGAVAATEPFPTLDVDQPTVEEVLRGLASADADSPIRHSELASPEEKIRLLEKALESYRGVILYQQDEIRRLRARVDSLEH